MDGFKAALASRKSQLSQVETRVRRADGRVQVERVAVDGGAAAEQLVCDAGETIPGSGGAFMVVDTSPDEDLCPVLAGELFLGSQDAACNVDGIAAAGVAVIVNLAVGVPCFFRRDEGVDGGNEDERPEIEYGEWPLLDLPSQSIDVIVDEVIPFMAAALDAGRPVLVHCNAGVSRSATAVLAYLIVERGMSYDEAMAMVRAARPASKPNAGFDAALRALDRERR
ncbi:dual specificity protein phosphatase 19 [Thecamonas trahens ATCC 50062]|uniref:Dual specificity protein phosphatase 19 n=1 Tax=Thecamonas trahens ATCC 50062 TaxID=461836 RepID=A0A0L0DA96_THETB|nr:dual specificity protein phosphatase 19 [Thecamonas trahens ATCC 50062]KNC49011.1 dual specificity protein phosphatase 19 [Thecamonas trahens ATCC 50062]|eukprot:XP_013758422.1 dual specificity protein phosphatase 19 [Thecamonas trahens ATCC 50062]